MSRIRWAACFASSFVTRPAALSTTRRLDLSASTEYIALHLPVPRFSTIDYQLSHAYRRNFSRVGFSRVNDRLNRKRHPFNNLLERRNPGLSRVAEPYFAIAHP